MFIFHFLFLLIVFYFFHQLKTCKNQWVVDKIDQIKLNTSLDYFNQFKLKLNAFLPKLISIPPKCHQKITEITPKTMIVIILLWLKSTEDKINASLKITSVMSSGNIHKPPFSRHNQSLISNSMPDFPPLMTSSVLTLSKNQKPAYDNPSIKQSKPNYRVNPQSL